MLILIVNWLNNSLITHLVIPCLAKFLTYKLLSGRTWPPRSHTRTLLLLKRIWTEAQHHSPAVLKRPTWHLAAYSNFEYLYNTAMKIPKLLLHPWKWRVPSLHNGLWRQFKPFILMGPFISIWCYWSRDCLRQERTRPSLESASLFISLYVHWLYYFQ